MAFTSLFGAVDISSQRDNQEGCTDAGFFVGVGFPNPLGEGESLSGFAIAFVIHSLDPLLSSQ